jgi:hypothetical protein
MFGELGTKRIGPCTGLARIGFEVGGRHYRILGYFGPSLSEFTLLYPFEKSDGPSYDAACPLAQTRKSEIESDGNRARICAFP